MGCSHQCGGRRRFLLFLPACRRDTWDKPSVAHIGVLECQRKERHTDGITCVLEHRAKTSCSTLRNRRVPVPQPSPEAVQEQNVGGSRVTRVFTSCSVVRFGFCRFPRFASLIWYMAGHPKTVRCGSPSVIRKRLPLAAGQNSYPSEKARILRWL